MPSFPREIALKLYRWSTMRARRRLAAQFKELGMYPASVLFYHRVADTHLNGWSITNANFLRHLDWIQQRAKFVSLDSIRQSQLGHDRRDELVGLTFDDGYAENCTVALPEVIRRGIPCTYFVASHYIESGEPFPHDSKNGVRLKPNTIQDIKVLASKGIEIGGHTHTHIDLGQNLSDRELQIEIGDSRKKLQDWSQQPVKYFAFPFGLQNNINQRAIDAVFEAGFECYVSASGGMNWPGGETHHLQRIHGDPGIAALQNWLTLDPRKLRSQLYALKSIPSKLESIRADLPPSNDLKQPSVSIPS